ncbi:hypothetical protein MBLNU459_g7724t1, partial [Dothideomycetes sp. NU459]
MSFLFKSSKKPQSAALPAATRNIKSSDGPAASPTPAVSQIPAPNGIGPPRDGNGNGKIQQLATPGSSVNTIDSLAEKTSLRNVDDSGPRNTAMSPNTPSPEQKSMRDRADSESQGLSNRLAMAPARPIPQDSSPYPWSQRHLKYTVSSNFPLPRYGAAVNSVASKDGSIYIMGGLINGSTVKGDLWMIDAPPANLSCYPVATTSEGPGPRVGHASLLVGNAFIVFGGDTKTDESDMLDDTLYLLNTSTKQWSRAAPAGPRPPGRYGHSLNILGSKIYIFGGQVEGFFFNDLVAFDLNALQQASNRWEILIQNTIDGGPPHGQIPPARTNHSMITWNDRLYLFGGTDGVTWFNDVWSYDPRTNSWTQLECIGYIPAAREGHASALVGDVMYVFGGRTEEGNDLGDLAAFRITSRRWYTFQNMGPSPSPRSGHSMTAFNKHIVVIGGEPSSAPRDAAELSLAYCLDTSKIRYPADSQSQTPVEQRIQGHRRPSGERSGLPLSQPRSMPPREQIDTPPDASARVMTRESSLPANRTNDQVNGGSRLPRAAGLSNTAALGAQSPRNGSPMGNGPMSRQPTRPDRALSPTNANNGPSSTMPSRITTMIPTTDESVVPRDRNAITSPTTFSNETSNAESDQDVAPQTYKPQTYQPYPPGESNEDRNGDALTRTPPRAKQNHELAETVDDIPRTSMDRANSSAKRTESRQDHDREVFVDSGVGSSPALSQLTDSLAKELESERNKNAWYASELALARKAGYSRSTTNSPALDERSADVFGDEDRPLVEALLKMRSELTSVQSSVDSQAQSAASRIAQVEKQRDAAIAEAVFVKAKLAAQSGDSFPDTDRQEVPDAERSADMNRRLASSLAAQSELSRRIDTLIHEKEAENQARQLAEDTVDTAQKRVTELDMDRQRHVSELESLRAELHELRTTAREASASHADILSAHQLLTVDHNEASGKLERALADTQTHSSVISSLREALTASTEKATLLEQQLGEEKSGRDDLEAKLAQLRSEHDIRTSELETTSRRLRDAEEVSEKHAAEARTHRQAVLDGLDKISTRDLDSNSEAADERVTILQRQVESANAMVKQNQAAADVASEKLRRAEERIAGLEAYQEQASREGLNMRKQLQSTLRDMKSINEQKADLQQQLQSQQLETNAIAVQHGALKNILAERGVNPSEVRKSRAVDSPSSQLRFGTPDIQRVKELEMQLDASLKSHDDMKAHFEEMQDREGMTRKEYEEKLTALDQDHQAAVKYLRGTEKMLSKMKQELQRVKNQAADYHKELETYRAKDPSSPSLQNDAVRSANWEQERDGLRKDLESMKTDLEAKIASLQSELGTRSADLESMRASHQATQAEFTTLLSTHDASRTDLERLQRDNIVLEERARDAENKVQLLLDQVESSVDNYRRQSSVPHGGMNGSAHRRDISNASVNTATNVPTHGHSRGDSLGNDSIYSQSIAPSEMTETGDLEGPDGRNSLALDSLASELETLRSHWETTKNYRLSDRFDFEKTPTAGTAPQQFNSLANWRRGLDVGDEDDGSRPSTAGSAK